MVCLVRAASRTVDLVQRDRVQQVPARAFPTRALPLLLHLSGMSFFHIELASRIASRGRRPRDWRARVRAKHEASMAAPEAFPGLFNIYMRAYIIPRHALITTATSDCGNCLRSAITVSLPLRPRLGGRPPPIISGSGARNQPPPISPADISKSPTPGLALAPVTLHQVQP